MILLCDNSPPTEGLGVGFSKLKHRYLELSIKKVLDLPAFVAFNCFFIFFFLPKIKRSKRKGHHGQRHTCLHVAASAKAGFPA